MAKFLKGNELNSALGKIFENAEDKLYLISPYIKLHHRFSDELKRKVRNDNLKIIVVFGKNENDLSKSLMASDLDFFKQFPNIEIRYEKRLHAKFYANEKTQIISSMNLYDFSQNENIEIGVLTEYNPLGNIASKLLYDGEKSLDQDAWDYFNHVIENSQLLFKNEPEYDAGFMGFGKKFKAPKNIQDTISEHFSKSSTTSKGSVLKESTSKKEINMGYCIRTGEQIPFNTKKPFSIKGYKMWAKDKNENYSENFCHKTGKPSNGKTTFRNPILQ